MAKRSETGAAYARDTAEGRQPLKRGAGIAPLPARSARVEAEDRGSKPACAGLDCSERFAPLALTRSGAVAHRDAT